MLSRPAVNRRPSGVSVIFRGTDPGADERSSWFGSPCRKKAESCNGHQRPIVALCPIGALNK
jgi:hypothetical protein